MEKPLQKTNDILREKLNEYRKKMADKKEIALATKQIPSLAKDILEKKKKEQALIPAPAPAPVEEEESADEEDEEDSDEEEEDSEEDDDEEEETLSLPEQEERIKVPKEQKITLPEEVTEPEDSEAEKEKLGKIMRFQMNELAVDNGLFRFSLLEAMNRLSIGLEELNASIRTIGGVEK